MGANVNQEAKLHMEGRFILRTRRKLRCMDAVGEATHDIKMPGTTQAATRFYVKNTIGLGMPTREGVRSEG